MPVGVEFTMFPLTLLPSRIVTTACGIGVLDDSVFPHDTKNINNKRRRLKRRISFICFPPDIH
jgi:hypothetical protein